MCWIYLKYGSHTVQRPPRAPLVCPGGPHSLGVSGLFLGNRVGVTSGLPKGSHFPEFRQKLCRISGQLGEKLGRIRANFGQNVFPKVFRNGLKFWSLKLANFWSDDPDPISQNKRLPSFDRLKLPDSSAAFSRRCCTETVDSKNQVPPSVPPGVFLSQRGPHPGDGGSSQPASLFKKNKTKKQEKSNKEKVSYGWQSNDKAVCGSAVK